MRSPGGAPAGSSSGLLPLYVLLLPAAATVTALCTALAPEPYMDEPFHVQQTQRYCAGEWRYWDPKITTFPGLYLFGAALGRLEHAAQRVLLGGAASDPELCSTTALRSVNLLFGAACLPLFYRAALRLDSSRSQRQLLLMATACFLFPLHFFFYFLYYTDVPALFFTLAAYLAGQYQRYHLAAVLGAIAVLMRQTNVVWVALILGSAIIEQCLRDSATTPPGDSSNGGSNGGSSSSGSGRGAAPEAAPAASTPAGSASSSKRLGSRGRRRNNMDGGGRGSSGSSSGPPPPPPLLRELGMLLQQAWLQRWQLLQQLWPLAAVVAAFAVFVLLNGGIVVGDKSHHAAVRHLVQPLYCLLYCTAWLAPVFWSPAALSSAGAGLASQLRRRPARTVALLAACGAAAAAAVHRFTLVHPFLLADNRHYTFYLWRRVLNRTRWARYAAIPAYLYSGWAIQRRLGHRRPLWVLLLAGASCAVLVPAQLVEFRYFTTPFFLLFLHMRTPSTCSLATIIALFAAANAATLYLFLYRPFTWLDGSDARFIW